MARYLRELGKPKSPKVEKDSGADDIFADDDPGRNKEPFADKAIVEDEKVSGSDSFDKTRFTYRFPEKEDVERKAAEWKQRDSKLVNDYTKANKELLRARVDPTAKKGKFDDSSDERAVNTDGEYEFDKGAADGFRVADQPRLKVDEDELKIKADLEQRMKEQAELSKRREPKNIEEEHLDFLNFERYADQEETKRAKRVAKGKGTKSDEEREVAGAEDAKHLSSYEDSNEDLKQLGENTERQIDYKSKKWMYP